MSPRNVKSVFFFPNGNIAVCNNNGAQICSLQNKDKKHLLFARLRDDAEFFGCTREQVERWSKGLR